MRAEIEPNFALARERYEEVLESILDYVDYSNTHGGDKDGLGYKKLEEHLHDMTGKDISKFDLLNWWEEGAEAIAFDIALPDPIKLDDISKDELKIIVERVKNFDLDDLDDEFINEFYRRTISLKGYFMQFLKLNFKNCSESLFLTNVNMAGELFEYSSDEIVDILWGGVDRQGADRHATQ